MPLESVGQHARHLARRTLDLGLSLATLRHGRRGLSILMYHRVLPADHPEYSREEPGMLLTPSTLQHHLQWLAPRCEIVHLDDWLQAAAANQPVPERACAITFDDGWADNHQYALPLLQAAGTPATVFVVSAMMDTNARFWPDLLTRVLEAANTNPAQLAELQAALPVDLSGPAYQVIDRAKTLPDSRLQQTLSALAQSWQLPTPGTAPLMSWDQVRDLTANDLVRIGSHTRHHQRMVPGLEASVLADELVHSQDEIADHLGTKPNLFCYPNGNTTADAQALVAKHYLGAVTTKTGIATAGSSPQTLPRVALHEDVSNTRSGFLARLAALR